MKVGSFVENSWSKVRSWFGRSKQPTVQEPLVQKFTVKAPEPDKPAIKTELSQTSGAARRRARKRKAQRKTKKIRSRQKHQ